MTTPRRALVVIDVQQEYFDGILQVQHPSREASLANILRALDTAAEHDLPVVVLQHELPEGAPVFAVGSSSWQLHPDIEAKSSPSWKRAVKSKASVFADTDVAEWLDAEGVDTITLVGYMTNNCDIATAAHAETLGLRVEVLRDATGAVHLANEAGQVSAENLHDALMVLLHSNFAAVATTDAWLAAVETGEALAGSDLGTSAQQGIQAFSR